MFILNMVVIEMNTSGGVSVMVAGKWVEVVLQVRRVNARVIVQRFGLISVY